MDDCAATIKISSVHAPPTDSFTVESVESYHVVSPKNALNGNNVEEEEESEYDSEYEYYTTTEDDEEEEEDEDKGQAEEGTSYFFGLYILFGGLILRKERSGCK